jgi:hypothetical protein
MIMRFESTEISYYVDLVEQNLTLRENAQSFVAYLRKQAQKPTVYLTPKQEHWLTALVEKANNKISQPEQPTLFVRRHDPVPVPENWWMLVSNTQH